jgi:hypothetical protein
LMTRQALLFDMRSSTAALCNDPVRSTARRIRTHARSKACPVSVSQISHSNFKIDLPRQEAAHARDRSFTVTPSQRIGNGERAAGRAALSPLPPEGKRLLGAGGR